MHARHKRHLMHGSHHKDGGHVPPHVTHGGTLTHGHGNVSHPKHKHRAKGGRTNHEPVNSGGDISSHDGQYGEHEPSLVAGNKNVVSAAKEKKSIGEVPGIYAKKRLDRRHRS